MNSIEVSAKNVDQAIEIGLFKLEAKREDVKIIILEEGGLFDKAKVKLILNSAYENQTPNEKLVSDFCDATGLKIFGGVEETPSSVKIDFSGEDIGCVIGKRGDVLDSLQFIFSQIINKNNLRENYKKVIIDSEGYRSKREDSLRSLALRLAIKAVKDKKTVNLEPMNAYERKIIHLTLEGRTDVTTVSTNEEPKRFVSIIPTNTKSGNPNKNELTQNDDNHRAYND